MARDDNRISMPQSGAGLTRYFDDEQSKVMIGPKVGIAIILLGIVIILVLTGV